MASHQDVVAALKLFHDHAPHKTFDMVGKSEMGEFAALKYLHESAQEGTTVTSRDISKTLGVSSARMTIVLQKLEAKGFIVKSVRASDLRVNVISLSENGNAFIEASRERMYQKIKKVVDTFGLEELELLFEKMSAIGAILHEDSLIYMEEDN